MIVPEKENMDLFQARILKKMDRYPYLTVLFQSFRYNTYSPVKLALAYRVPEYPSLHLLTIKSAAERNKQGY
jgi:hypothetical protein